MPLLYSCISPYPADPTQRAVEAPRYATRMALPRKPSPKGVIPGLWCHFKGVVTLLFSHTQRDRRKDLPREGSMVRILGTTRTLQEHSPPLQPRLLKVDVGGRTAPVERIPTRI